MILLSRKAAVLLDAQLSPPARDKGTIQSLRVSFKSWNCCTLTKQFCGNLKIKLRNKGNQMAQHFQRASTLPQGDKAYCYSGHVLEKSWETAVLSLSWKVWVLSNTCLTPFCVGKTCLMLCYAGWKGDMGRRRSSCFHELPGAGLILKTSQYCTIFHVKWSCFTLDAHKISNQKKTFLQANVLTFKAWALWSQALTAILGLRGECL